MYVDVDQGIGVRESPMTEYVLLWRCLDPGPMTLVVQDSLPSPVPRTSEREGNRG